MVHVPAIHQSTLSEQPVRGHWAELFQAVCHLGGSPSAQPLHTWWYRIAELTVGMWGFLSGCRFTFHCCLPYWRLIGLHAKQDAVQNPWLPLMTNGTYWFINSDIKVIPVWLKSPFLSQGAVHLSVMLTDSWAWWTQHPSLSHKALHSKFHVILTKGVGQPSLASTKGLRSWHRR
jgi:hypothetical protein